MLIKSIQKGYLFREKWYIKGKGLDLGAKPPRKNICWVPLSPAPPPHPPEFVALATVARIGAIRVPNEDIVQNH